MGHREEPQHHWTPPPFCLSPREPIPSMPTPAATELCTTHDMISMPDADPHPSVRRGPFHANS